MFRGFVRKSEILFFPGETRTLSTMESAPLHQDLVNFYVTGMENYSMYKTSQIEAILNPLFITLEDEINYNDGHSVVNS